MAKPQRMCLAQRVLIACYAVQQEHGLAIERIHRSFTNPLRWYLTYFKRSYVDRRKVSRCIPLGSNGTLLTKAGICLPFGSHRASSSITVDWPCGGQESSHLPTLSCMHMEGMEPFIQGGNMTSCVHYVAVSVRGITFWRG